MSGSAALTVAAALLLLNAFFVGAEFAVISARRSQLEPLAQAGGRRARTTLWAIGHLPLMLACAQLGITVCSLGLGAVAGPAVAGLLEPVAVAARVPTAAVAPLAYTLGLAAVVYLHVVVGELVPKNLALAGPERAAIALAPVLVGLARGLAPVIAVLRRVTNLLLRILGVEPKDELTSAFTAEEVHSIVTQSRREGLLDDRHHLLTGALELGGRTAGDVMVARDRLVTVAAGSSPEQVERLVARTGFSRFPVVGPAPGPAGDPSGQDVIGYLHLKDLLYADEGQYARPVPAGRVRSLACVHPDDEVEEALAAMQRSGAHLARVAERDGATLGVLFLEDVLEELVGEVRDATQRGPTLAR